VERIELHRLDRAAVARQLAAILGTPPGEELTRTVFDRSEGNPFYAEELLAAGAGSRRLPTTLREVLAARLALVSDGTMRVLGVAAIAGRRVDHDLLAAVAGIDEERLLDALQEATTAQLLVADDALAEGYAFRHALIGEAAAETVLPGERRRLHVAIATALDAKPWPAGPERAVHLAEIAHHWSEAREPERAFAASLAAGDGAFESHAYAASQRQLERAIELWDLVPAAREAAAIDRIELLRRTARSAQLAGDYPRARAHLREAIESLDPATERSLLGALHERLGRAYWTDSMMADALVHYERALDLVPAAPPSEDRARVLAGYAQAMMLVGRYSESERFGEEARAMAQALGNRLIEGHATTTVGGAKSFRGEVEEGIALGRAGLAIALEVKDYDDVGRAYANLAQMLDVAGRYDESIDISYEGAAAMRRVGLATTYGAFNLLNAADGLYVRGRWAELADVLDEVLPMSTGVAAMFGQQVSSQLLVARGQFETARDRLARMAEHLGATPDAQFNGPYSRTLIELAAWSGDVAAGRAAADRGLAVLGATEDVEMFAMVVAAAARIEADAAERARAGRDEGGAKQAEERVRELLRQLDGRLAAASPPETGAEEIAAYRATAAAEAARASGQADPDAWGVVLDAERRGGRPYRAAYAAWRAAEAVLARAGDRADAAALLGEAISTARALAASPLESAVASLAARARIELPGEAAATVDGGGTAGSTTAGAAANPVPPVHDLTPRELEVLRLLASGRTNRQIADELFISESTAGVHVSHILGKLGVAGRVEAAAIAVRLGLAG
jgi:DNA-binding CsgD family transcriptional regulator